MAFTGSATVTSLGKYRARITGLSLAAGANGTIGLNGDSGAGVQLPAAFPTAVDGSAGALTMSDIVRAQAKRVAAKNVAAATVGANIAAFTDPPSAAEMAALRTFVNALKTDQAAVLAGAAKDITVTKGGSPFRVTVTNDDATNATPELEIEVEFQHGGTR